MPQIKFTNEKADRWIERIQKRSSKLTAEDQAVFQAIRSRRQAGERLLHPEELALFALERKV